MVRIWTHSEAKYDEPLPPIISCILDHGEDRWKAATAFAALFDLGDDEEVARALLHHTPRFDYLVDDLSAVPDERLRARAMSEKAKVAALLLENARYRADLLDRLAAWADLIQAVLQHPDGLLTLETFVR